ncbi:hypothetical protein EJ110_NYTH16199 [Nymphaea thermarum]|nr:hypothetical protein EJ110_NYTH16199 [Nymphaea thermarum]
MEGTGDEIYLSSGFRFHPTNEELLVQYLLPKTSGLTFTSNLIAHTRLMGPARCIPHKSHPGAEPGFSSWAGRQSDLWIRTDLGVAGKAFLATPSGIFSAGRTRSSPMGQGPTGGLDLTFGRLPAPTRSSWSMAGK